jgi:hypothetical protein
MEHFPQGLKPHTKTVLTAWLKPRPFKGHDFLAPFKVLGFRPRSFKAVIFSSYFGC